MNMSRRDLEQLAVCLASNLRLQLVAELLGDRAGVTVEEAAVRTACPEGDVVACLRPMVGLGLIEELDGGKLWRLRSDIRAEPLALLKNAVRRAAPNLKRQRHVRNELLRGMIGSDPKMQLVTEMVRKVARLDVPVLITGETGTGKELVARAIHELSGRSSGFFGDVNCATLTEPLFESHVFGHARGAFTGAVRATAGLVERADGGTLFLDEIGELGLENQVKLLKVLQSRTFTRLGETTARSSNFRLVSATNRHLPAMTAAGTFREDLFYRINVFPIILPALRERLDDLPHLVEEIILRSVGVVRRNAHRPAVTSAAMDRLRCHDWPGNIRELENVLTRAMISSGGEPIDASHLPPLESTRSDGPSPQTSGMRSLEAVERDHVTSVLAAVGGNVSVAAEVLEISRTTLYRKMREHGIHLRRTLQQRR